MAAKIGQSNCFFVWLVELRLASGTKYFSKGMAVNYNGHSWVPRILSIDGLSAAYIDANGQDFATPTFRFSNLADDGSTNFYFTGLDSAESFANREVRVHLYDVDSGTAVDNFWAGYLESPTYSADGSEVEIGATFVWNVLDLVAPKIRLTHKCQYAFFNETWDGSDSIGCPYHTFGTAGFTSCAHNATDCSARGMLRFYPGWPVIGLDPAKRGREDIRKAAVPIVYGAGAFHIRPQIYLVRVVGNELWVNFIISGVHPNLPFDPADIDVNDVRIFGSTRATAVEIKYGAYPEALPVNLTRFPDELAHSMVCHGWATFPITNEQKDNLNVDQDEMKIGLLNGKKIKTTGLPSGNPALQMRDYIQDKLYCLGLPDSAMNLTIQAGTESYVGTRYQTRYVFNEQTRLIDIVPKMLRDFHGFITFDNAQMAIGCKRNDSTPVATFGTGGRMILNNYVKFYEKKEDELKNQSIIKFRHQNYHPDEILYDDKGAQQAAGNGIEKIIPDEFESLGLYDPGDDSTQIQINAAIYLREMLNGNGFIEFDVAVNDGIDVLPGEIIRVNNPRIPNNATNNYLFRVLPYKINPDNFTVHFTCQLYKSTFYADTADPIGTDVIRTTDDTTRQGRPPDVTPNALQIIVATPPDTEGKTVTMRAVFTVPAFDAASEQSQGTFREPPISEVEIWWRYTDEPIHSARFGNRLKISQQATSFLTSIDFQVDYQKNRTVEAYYVAVGTNRAHADFGLIPDTTKVTTLTVPLSATGATANVAATGSYFNMGDYCQIELERLQVASKTSNTITFVNSAGVRTPQFGTASIIHAAKVQITVLKQSYPSLIQNLTAAIYQYPPVASLTARKRPDGIRWTWPDISATNQEKYILYWTTSATIAADPNGLGSTQPKWYKQVGPLSPPSGINYKITDDSSYLLPFEEIGGANITVYGRVAARNGKNDYSTDLSPMDNSAAGGGPGPSDAPFPPNIAHLLSNVPVITPEGLKAKCTFRVFPYTSVIKTFADNNISSIQLIFNLASGGKERPVFPIEDTSQTFIDVVVYFAMGEQPTWVKTIAYSPSGGSTFSTGSVSFFAGGSQTALTGITGLAVMNVTALDKNHSEVTWGFTMPATPALVSHALIKSLVPGGSSFKKRLKVPLLSDPNNQTAGAKTFTETIQHPKNASVQWLVTLVSVDSTTLDSAVFTRATPDDDTGPPNNGTALTITHKALKNGRTLIVRFVMPTAQMVSHSKNVLIIHDNNVTGTGRKFFEPATQQWVNTYSDGTTEMDIGKGGVPAMNLPSSALSVGGRTAIHVRVGVWNAFNGGSPTYSPDVGQVGYNGQINLDSTTGAEPVDRDTSTPDVSTLQGVFRYDGGKELMLECPLPSANMATFTKVELAIQFQDSPGNILGYLTRNSSGQYIVSGSEAFFDLGRESSFTLNIKKASLKSLVPSAFKLVFYYYVSNALGRSTSHSNGRIIFIDLDIYDYLSSRGVPVTLDVGATMYSTQNLIEVGDFDKDRALNTVKGWYRWNGLAALAVSTIGGGGPRLITTTAGQGILWSPSQHNVAITDGTFYLCKPIPELSGDAIARIGSQLKPGELYSLSMRVRSAVNGFSPVIKAWLVKDNAVATPGASGINLDNANLLASVLTIPTAALGGLSSSVYKLGGNYQKLPNTASLGNGGSPNQYVQLWLVIGVPAGFAAGNQVIFDGVKFTQGAQPSTFTYAPSEVPGVVDSWGSGIVPGNVGDLIDATYIPSGDLGGYSVQGGLFS